MGLKHNHSQLVKAGVILLHAHGCMAWKNNTGAYQPSGTRRWIRFGATGSPDILGIAPNGRAICAEAKLPPDSPSPAQQSFLDDARQHNAFVVTFYNLEELEKALLDAGL